MRTETTTREIFTFDELSDSAKETARQWWRESGIDDGIGDYIFDDAQQCASILGIELDETQIPLMNGKTRPAPKIYYSGFSSQGDGACFEGSYSYTKGSTLAIRAYAPQDTELHRIADGLQAIQKTAFYQLYASASHSGHYYHSGCMAVSVDRDSSNYQDMTSEQESEVIDLLRGFADWIYSRLEKEYEWLNSDEQVDESIIGNGYEFDAIGRMA